MSWPRSPIIASPHCKDALETASVSAGAGVHAGPDVVVHVPGVMSMLMFTFRCMCLCLCFVIVHVWVRAVSCQPKSMALPSTHDGMA